MNLAVAGLAALSLAALSQGPSSRPFFWDRPCTPEIEVNGDPWNATFAGMVQGKGLAVTGCGDLKPGDKADWWVFDLNAQSPYYGETWANFLLLADASAPLWLQVYQQWVNPYTGQTWIVHAGTRYGAGAVALPELPLEWHPLMCREVLVRVSGLAPGGYTVSVWR